MAIKVKTVKTPEEVTEDVICDICGKSCKKRINDPIVERTMEYMELKTSWGFYSNKDLETWEAEVCEDCVDKHLSPLIKFKKISTFSGKIIKDKS
jgi:uncharacterized cysteine cluster protein YcgN (CxxCxxCC family)